MNNVFSELSLIFFFCIRSLIEGFGMAESAIESLRRVVGYFELKNNILDAFNFVCDVYVEFFIEIIKKSVFFVVFQNSRLFSMKSVSVRTSKNAIFVTLLRKLFYLERTCTTLYIHKITSKYFIFLYINQ